MADWLQDVMEFHRACGIPIGDLPQAEHSALRDSLEDEELDELRDAKTPAEFADAIVDLVYVLIGRAVTLGIDIRPVWDEVQRANMAKTAGPKREDGKQLKPEGWVPPDVAGVLARQGALCKK